MSTSCKLVVFGAVIFSIPKNTNWSQKSPFSIVC